MENNISPKKFGPCEINGRPECAPPAPQSAATRLSPVKTRPIPVFSSLSPVATRLSPVKTILSAVATRLSPVKTILSAAAAGNAGERGEVKKAARLWPAAVLSVTLTLRNFRRRASRQTDRYISYI